AEGCNYLLAVDVDMNTVSGYAMSSWDRGYGDFVFKPDLATLRLVPWQEGTALVMCDLTWEDGSPVLASPRGVLKRQLERLAERGWAAYSGTELEFIVFRDSYEEAWAKAYRDLRPANDYNVDYSLLGTARIERPLRCARPGSSRCCPASATPWPGRACGSSRPRASATTASTRSPSATPTPWPPPTATSSTRTGPRRSPPRTAAA